MLPNSITKFKSNPSFKEINKIYFIGIGGIGMSGLAQLLQFAGKNISGSDKNKSTAEKLINNFEIKVHQQSENLNHLQEFAPDLIIYTTAIPDSNNELIFAKNNQIKTITYPEAVGLLTTDFKLISIIGTHGKTTITSMALIALNQNSQIPTGIVGSLVPELNNKNFQIGNSDYFILESCEYKDAFLNYKPQIVILSNIDPDHLEYFGTKENYLKSFEKFLNKLPENGLLIHFDSDPNIQEVISKLPSKIKKISYGLNSNSTYYLKENQLFHQNQLLFNNLQLDIPGEHNRLNATATIALAQSLNFSVEESYKKIQTFKGAKRRFEFKQIISETPIYDDYAHHPTEIKATLQAVKEEFGPEAKILVVFQPHQYSRLRLLKNEFIESLLPASKVLIPNIYEARDSQEDKASISAESFVNELNQNKNFALHTQNLENTANQIKESCHEFDCVIIMGAGDITNIFNLLNPLN